MSERLHVLIAEARFYPELADEMLRGAIGEIERRGGTWESVAVPGSFELPGAIRLGIAAGHAGTRRFDAYVALGCVIRGETTHYDHVCEETSRGIMQLALDHGVAVGFGLLTCETWEQAWARGAVAEGNKGAAAAAAALDMAALRRRFGLPPA